MISPQLRLNRTDYSSGQSTKRPDVSGSFSSASRRVLERTSRTTANDGLVARFPLLARLPALGRHARRRDRIPAALTASLAAAERVIRRVHTGTAIVRLAALPAHSTGLA